MQTATRQETPGMTTKTLTPAEVALREKFVHGDGEPIDPKVIMVNMMVGRRSIKGVRVVEGKMNQAEQDARRAEDAKRLGLDPNAYRDSRTDSGLRVFEKNDLQSDLLVASLNAQGYVMVDAHQREMFHRDGRSRGFRVTLEFVENTDDIQEQRIPGHAYGKLMNLVWTGDAWANPVVDPEGKVVARKDTINLKGGQPTERRNPKWTFEATTGDNDEGRFTYEVSRA